MSVTIDPAEQLEFHRPLTRTNKESLFVKNPNPTPVIFKVKTTAPKQYCVRPNAGRIEGNSEIEVQIILQAFKEEPAEDYKCKDKFLVQTAPINETLEPFDITAMWAHVETEERENMHQHKIKCVFLPARPGDDELVIVANDDAEEQEKKSQPSSTDATLQGNQVPPPAPVPAAALSHLPPTPAVTAPIPAPAPAPVPVVPETTTSTTETASHGEAPSSKLTTTATTTTAAAEVEKKSPVPPPVPAPRARAIVSEKKNDVEQDELKIANETIKQLRQQLEELQQIRSRNNNSTTGGGRKLASTVQPLDAVHQHLAALEKPRPTEGYPPQVVLGVAALVFVFTYLFF
ncbi:VAMP-associated protein [Backusella circina FSU 941]|nr:VAMP-associated protein [Backusella circina FSU 941]